MTAHAAARALADIDPALVLVEGVAYAPARWSWEIEQVIEADLDSLPAGMSPRARRWLDRLPKRRLMHRLFVALRPPEDIRDRLIDVMDDGADFRWQSDDQLHLTLRFIGEVERPLANDLVLALASMRAPAFELRLTGLASFDRRSGGVLFAAIAPGRAGQGSRRAHRAHLPGCRPAARAPRFPPPHHARPLARPAQPRSPRVSGWPPASIGALHGRPLHPLRKPPVPPWRAL